MIMDNNENSGEKTKTTWFARGEGNRNGTIFVIAVTIVILIVLCMVKWFPVIQGMTLSDQGKTEEAIAVFTQAIASNPDNKQAYVERGHCYAKQGNYEKAIADCEKALKIDKDCTQALVVRGLIYKMGEDYNHALVDFTGTIEKEKDNHSLWQNSNALRTAYFQRANIYFIQRDFINAIEDYTKAIELDYGEAAYIGRGDCYFKQSNFTQAISNYTKAIELNPKNGQIYAYRSCAHENLGNTAQAEADLAKARELEGKNTSGEIKKVVLQDSQKSAKQQKESASANANAVMHSGSQKSSLEIGGKSVEQRLEEGFAKHDEMAKERKQFQDGMLMSKYPTWLLAIVGMLFRVAEIAIIAFIVIKLWKKFSK